MTGASLWALLKKENPSAFYARMEKRNDFWTLITLLNHKDIAEYFYNINPDGYVWHEVLGWYSLEKTNIWKHYEKSVPSGLKRNLADTMMALAMDTKKAELARYAKASEAEKDQKKQQELTRVHLENIKVIHSAYKQFGSSETCNGVISFLPSYYEKDDLETTMDMNRNLFAFKDGVYDCEAGKFRPIQPQDYISTTTGYAYPKQTNEAVRKEILDMVYGLFEDEETKTYLLRVLASCIFGGNRWEEFYVFTGVGGNGKGVIGDLVKVAFGEYYISVSNTLFTKSVDKKDQPIPALVEARCKRIMMTTEPEGEDTLKIGILKQVSGGDNIEARTLYSKHIIKYVPQFKLILQTNTIPQLSSIDLAIQRRMRVVQFPFQFLPKEKMNMAHHRLGDPDVKDKKCKSAEWRDEFILLMTQIYHEIKDWKSLPQPTSVQATTSEYMDTNNPLKVWLERHYIITRLESDVVGSTELKGAYGDDMRIDRKDMPTDKKFKELLIVNSVQWKHTRNGNIFWGLKRKEDEEGV
jgi:P4 family phage/plasmid primase-like protien